jgi:putative transposase
VSEKDDPEHSLAVALFRYRLIADAIEAPKEARTAILRAVAEEEPSGPSGKRVSVTLRTLQRWVERYEENKLSGLMRIVRRDKGKPRSLSVAALQRVIELRREEPARSTPTLIDIVERSGEIAEGALKRSTLDRHLDKHAASRRMMHVLGTKRHVRLDFPCPMDFVVGDFHAGPWVLTDSGEIRRTELQAFIDHTSRYVPDSRYGMSENLMAVRQALRGLCTAWGAPKRIYVDNGPGYQANRFHFGCSELGIDLVHSKPYISEGRGLIERFNRTVKESFEVEVRLRKEPPTLAELNAFWRAFLEERYHRRKHSETGEPPLQRWQRMMETTQVRRVDPVLLDEVLRLHARRMVHCKTSTVEVGGVKFVVDTSLRKRRVEVLYDPHDLSSVLVYFDGRRIERAKAQVLGERPIEAPLPATRPAPSVDYLGLLQRDYERRRAEQLSSIRFGPANDVSACVSIGQLCERLTVCTGHRLGEVERQLAVETLDALSPIEVSIADAALKSAVVLLGHGLHASQYLNALREHVLLARKKGHP